MATTEIIKGTCNCKAVSIEFPKSSYPETCIICHCLSCRNASGGLFSIDLSIPMEHITTIGAPKIYDDMDTASGKPLHRYFCGDCGSAIFSTVEAQGNKTAYVKGGLFCKNGIELPPPGAEIFWNRREKWEVAAQRITPR